MSDFFKNLERSFNLLDAQAFDANRRGEITTVQKQQLSSIAVWKNIIILTIAILILGGIFSFAFFPIILARRWFADMLPILALSGVFLVPIAFLGYGIVSQLRRSIKLNRDLANRAIREGQGQLLYGKKGYLFDMGGTTLSMPANQSNGLLPGTTYQVCYLEESGVLLSATVVSQATPAQMRTALNDILASANGFTGDDFLANQNGSVTFAQRKKLFPAMLFGAAIILLPLIWMIPVALPYLSSPANASSSNLLFVVMVFGILSLFGFILMMRALLDVLAPGLQQVQGIVMKEQRVVSTGKGSHVEYYYTIGKQRFTVNFRAYTALIDGLQYRIYYLARSKKLISIEVLDAIPHP